ncbi:MAG: lyase family protein, partial [Chloroflexota bacterium]
MTQPSSGADAAPATRTEKDPLGPLDVPADAYYGVQTQRAINNFPISGRLPDYALVAAAVNVKKAAARANRQTGRLPDGIAAAIIQAADEILGLHESDLRQTLIANFRVDPFQAGAGVSHNMNTNE